MHYGTPEVHTSFTVALMCSYPIVRSFNRQESKVTQGSNGQNSSKVCKLVLLSAYFWNKTFQLTRYYDKGVTKISSLCLM